MKHFKTSQQIEYATDHGNSYADKKRKSQKKKKKDRAHSYHDLPLGDSSSKYGVQ
jgi:hypothetical protein